jgi:hypothetical protein
MHPSSSLRGTFEPDDVNSIAASHPAPRIAGHTGLQGLVGSGRDTRLGQGLLLRRVSL